VNCAPGEPDATCRAVVHEYLDAGDLLAYERARNRNVRCEASGLRVLFPRDGDRFVWYPGGPTQRLQFMFGDPRGRLDVTLNGRTLTPIEGGYRWPVARRPTASVSACAAGRKAVRMLLDRVRFAW
jgi:hypothetical protein